MKRFLIGAIAVAAFAMPAAASAQDAATCPTPVETCVQQLGEDAQALANQGTDDAQALANLGIDLAQRVVDHVFGPPPHPEWYCYVLWGQPCVA